MTIHIGPGTGSGSSTIRDNLAVLQHEDEQLRLMLDATNDPAERADLYGQAATNLEEQALARECLPGPARRTRDVAAELRHWARLSATAGEIESLRARAAQRGHPLPDPTTLIRCAVNEQALDTLHALYTAMVDLITTSAAKSRGMRSELAAFYGLLAHYYPAHVDVDPAEPDRPPVLCLQLPTGDVTARLDPADLPAVEHLSRRRAAADEPSATTTWTRIVSHSAALAANGAIDDAGQEKASRQGSNAHGLAVLRGKPCGGGKG